MRIVRGIFSGILSFVLVIVLVILGIAITVNHTILNPNFVISELDKLDVYSVVVEQIRNQITSQLPEQEPYVAQVVDETLTDLQPWLRQQARAGIYSGYAYLKGEEGLNIVISLEEVRASIKENLAQAMRESLPPELEGVPQSQIEAFISQACAEIDSQIPEQIEVNEALLGPEIVTPLQKAKEIISYIELGYKVSIGLAALLVLIIALIQWWHVKPISRYIGISFTIAGAFSFVGTIAARSLVSHAIQLEIPLEISAKLPQLISDFTSPLQIYSLALLIVGIGLIVLSIKLKTSDAESP